MKKETNYVIDTAVKILLDNVCVWRTHIITIAVLQFEVDQHVQSMSVWLQPRLGQVIC